jgi:hypothetical protein
VPARLRDCFVEDWVRAAEACMLSRPNPPTVGELRDETLTRAWSRWCTAVGAFESEHDVSLPRMRPQFRDEDAYVSAWRSLGLLES